MGAARRSRLPPLRLAAPPPLLSVRVSNAAALHSVRQQSLTQGTENWRACADGGLGAGAASERDHTWVPLANTIAPAAPRSPGRGGGSRWHATRYRFWRRATETSGANRRALQRLALSQGGADQRATTSSTPMRPRALSSERVGSMERPVKSASCSSVKTPLLSIAAWRSGSVSGSNPERSGQRRSR